MPKYQGKDYYNSPEECIKQSKNIYQTNPRYTYFTQHIFTVGDEDQFKEYRNMKNYPLSKRQILLDNNIFKDTIFNIWEKYTNIQANAVTNTFRYIFHKFKKGIFIKIVNNKLNVFLPFSKASFINEWSDQIQLDPIFKNNTFLFLEYIAKLSGYNYNPKTLNTSIEEWYANNSIIRYDLSPDKNGNYYPTEGDTNIGTIKNMIENLCAEREIPDIEFFVNRRDFPIITKDGTEPYNNIWNSTNKPLVSHNYSKYSPILSMCTSDKYADINIPTYEDWARVQQKNNIWFPKSYSDYNTTFNKNWNSKKPTAVFRGSSTGTGVTIETNPRLKLSHLSKITEYDENGIPYLDAGITKWNMRPRKIQGEKYLKIIDVNKLPFDLVKKLSPLEQSNYKYIINVDGHVSAFRTSLELNMGSVILMVQSKWKIWYKDMLKPYVHYIPIKEDLSDLINQIKWCRNNDEKCQEIVKNTQSFFDTYLQRKGILDYLQKTLINLKNNMGNYLYLSKTPLDIQIDNEYNSFTYNFPETNKKIENINSVPNCGRSYQLLQAMQWTINMIITKSNFEDIAKKNKVIFTNKFGVITQWTLANFNLAVKTTSDKRKIKEHIHDNYIGLNSINSLTEIIPNFTYVFGLYESNNSYNVITEYIKGETLFNYISSDKFCFDDYLLIMIQICLALEVAQKQCSFVHNDLTPWNIILQYLPKTQKVDYILSHKKQVRINTNIIPVIIDYGKSHSIHNEEHHGFINMFKTSTSQDILILLVKSIQQIVSIHKNQLSKKDRTNIILLANFITKTKYCPTTFNSLYDIEKTMKRIGKYSNLVEQNKYELENVKPIDLVNYIYKNMTENYPKILSYLHDTPKNDIKYIMNNGVTIQFFNYIFSNTIKEKIESYKTVFNNIIHNQITQFVDPIFVHYTAQKLEDSILSNWKNMLIFLKENNTKPDKYEQIFKYILDYTRKIYTERIQTIKNKKIEYDFITSNSTEILYSYTEESFLDKEVIRYITKQNNIYQDLIEYKNIIEYVLLNNGYYKIQEKEIYIVNLKSLLNTNSLILQTNSANLNTMSKFLTNYIF